MAPTVASTVVTFDTTDVAVTVARVVAIGFGVFALLGGPFQLLILAPYLWMMGTQERTLARMMADRYVSTRDGYRERSGGRTRGRQECIR